MEVTLAGIVIETKSVAYSKAPSAIATTGNTHSSSASVIVASSGIMMLPAYLTELSGEAHTVRLFLSLVY